MPLATQAQVSKTVTTNFTQFAIPAKAGDIRVATFNTAMNSDDIDGNAGDASAVANALASGTHPSIKRVAEVIQRVNPDVVLLNESRSRLQRPELRLCGHPGPDQ